MTFQNLTTARAASQHLCEFPSFPCASTATRTAPSTRPGGVSPARESFKADSGAAENQLVLNPYLAVSLKYSASLRKFRTQVVPLGRPRRDGPRVCLRAAKTWKLENLTFQNLATTRAATQHLCEFASFPCAGTATRTASSTRLRGVSLARENFKADSGAAENQLVLNPGLAVSLKYSQRC